MGDQQKVVYGLSNCAIFNDIEQPLTQFSRSCYSLTLNITVVQWNTNRDLHTPYSTVSFRMTLSDFE